MILYRGFEIQKLSLSISEAAKLLNLDRELVRQKIRTGELEIFLTPGRIQRKVSMKSIIDFLLANSFQQSQYKEAI